MDARIKSGHDEWVMYRESPYPVISASPRDR
jgi:hypothetical protein